MSSWLHTLEWMFPLFLSKCTRISFKNAIPAHSTAFSFFQNLTVFASKIANLNDSEGFEVASERENPQIRPKVRDLAVRRVGIGGGAKIPWQLTRCGWAAY